MRKARTKAEHNTTCFERRQLVIENLKNSNNYCGKNGCIFEVECARKASRKLSVSKQGQTDVFVRFATEKGYKYLPCECKTNGGRVDDLLNGTNKSKFVIYRLDFTQKHKATKKHGAWEEVRHVDPVIIPTELFCAVLRHFGAVKTVAHKGVVDGLAIQPSNKRLYEWLLDYPITFNNDATYTADDFEGLGL